MFWYQKMSTIKLLQKTGRVALAVLICILMIYMANRILLYSFSISNIPITYRLFNVPYLMNENTNQIEKSFVEIEDILVVERKRIATQMKGFNYTDEMKGLEALTPETDGRPLRSLILSTWRSGSTFFGEVLSSMPGSFYHFEPLLYMMNERMHDPPKSVEGINTLRRLLQCNYTGLNQYIDFVFFSFNRRLWQVCETFPSLCKDANFLNAYCRIYPFQSMKLVRLPAKQSEPLLTDPQLNVKIVLLTRDPRATMASRIPLPWCRKNKDCGNVSNLCSDMVSDYKVSKYLVKKYPSQFKVIRYEDLSLNPFKVIEDVLSFYGFPFHENVKHFLETHTGRNVGEMMSTFRDSKQTVYHWMHNISFTQIEHIQSRCTEAMSLWGYRKVDDEKSLKNSTFDPVMDFSFSVENGND